MNRSSAISRETSSETTHHFPTEKGTFDRAGHLRWRMVRSIAIKWSLHPAFGRFNKSSRSGARPCYELLALAPRSSPLVLRLSFFVEKKENWIESAEFQLYVSAYQANFEPTFSYFLSFAYYVASNNQPWFYKFCSCMICEEISIIFFNFIYFIYAQNTYRIRGKALD